MDARRRRRDPARCPAAGRRRHRAPRRDRDPHGADPGGHHQRDGRGHHADPQPAPAGVPARSSRSRWSRWRARPRRSSTTSRCSTCSARPRSRPTRARCTAARRSRPTAPAARKARWSSCRPSWVKRAYPLLVITILIAIVFAVFVKVPTYSTGTAVIVFEGSTSVTATAERHGREGLRQRERGGQEGRPAGPAGVSRRGRPARRSPRPSGATPQIQFLFDQTDEQVRKSLMSAATAA